MTTDLPKHPLDRRLVEALWNFGLEASVESEPHVLSDEGSFISVRVGGDNVTLATVSTDSPDDRTRAVKAAERLSERNDVNYAVAVCYGDKIPHESTEETRYTWRAIPGEQDSEWITGRVADLALIVALAPAGPREPGDSAHALADYLSECNADTLAKVLPHSGATSHDYAEFRQFAAEAFLVEFIVASHDRRRVGFTGNGRRPEILLVCKPRAAIGEEPPVTRVINLSSNPSTPEDAWAAGSDIRRAIESGEESAPGRGTVQGVEFRELEEGDWGAVHFLSPLLREKFRQLRDEDMFRRVYLGSIAEISPTGRTVRDVFIPEPSIDADASEYKALWGHGSNNVQKMRAKAETTILAKPGKQVSADGCWELRSRLLLPLQPHLPKARSMAVRLDEPTLGSMWTNCRIKPKYQEPQQLEKALCVYLNSTIGILTMLGGFARDKELTRRRSTVMGWEMLAVPDFTHLDAALKALVAAFDELGDLELLPLPQLDSCPVRNAIDAAVRDALGISDELVRSIRKSLVAEPSMVNSNDAKKKAPRVDNRQMPFLPLFQQE